MDSEETYNYICNSALSSPDVSFEPVQVLRTFPQLATYAYPCTLCSAPLAGLRVVMHGEENCHQLELSTVILSWSDCKYKFQINPRNINTSS